MSLLDNFFNTKAPDYMQGLLGDTTDIQNRANTTGLVNMALGYLAAPKHQQLGLGRILAGSYMAGQQGAQGTYDNALQDWQTKQKIDDYKKKQTQEQALTDFRQNIGKPNDSRQVITHGQGMIPMPQVDGATVPQFGLQNTPDTTTTEQFYNPNKEIEHALQSGALDIKDYLTLQSQKSKDSPYGKIDPKDYTPESVQQYSLSGDYTKLRMATKPNNESDTNDMKGFRFARTPEGGNFGGSFEKYLQIKPALMANVAGGQLAVAQQNSDNTAENTAYNTGRGRAASPKTGKTASLADIADTARQSGKTTKQVTADLKAAGYRIGQ